MLISVDRIALCDFLVANESDTNCTIGVGNVASYFTSFNCPEIIDQLNNPTGSFNISQLHQQARQLPYVMTDLLNSSDIMMLYNAVLPEHPIPNIKFLYDNVTTSTISVNPISTRRPESM